MWDLEQINWATVLLSAVVAIFSGAAGGYYSQKFTDKRRAIEQSKKEQEGFASVAAQYPSFIKAIQDDLKSEGGHRIRHIALDIDVGIQGGMFAYDTDDFENVEFYLETLCGQGLLTEDVRTKYCRYHMSEDFVRQVLAWQPPTDKT